MTPRVRGAAAIAIVGWLAAAIICLAGWESNPPQRTALKQLYTPSFSPPPAHEDALVSLQKLPYVYAFYNAHQRCCQRSQKLPGQAATFLIAFVVMAVAGFNFRNLRDPRNVDVIITQVIGWCFFDILGFSEHMDTASFNIMDWLFTAIVFLTLTLLVRALRRIRHSASLPPSPLLGRTALAALALALVALDVADALATPPDDAGYFINIGAQRLRERGRWPYGDPLLTSTPAAAYGPVLYLAHLPFQFAMNPQTVNAPMTRPPIEAADVYMEPPMLATQLTTTALHLVGLASLFLIAFRLAGERTAWALVALYCSSVFVLGVGDGDDAIGGMTFVSHMGPSALSLLALALVSRPAWSGAALAAAGGALFYPFFFVPAWVGYYSTRRGDLSRFLIGFGLVSVLIGVSVLLLSRPAGGRGLVGTIVNDTIGHQESLAAYGKSVFGFWGQREGFRKVLMTPLADDQSFTRPVVVAFFVFVAGTYFIARRRSTGQLALIAAAIAMGAQLWKIHATGTYVAWYYPLLLVGLFCDAPAAKGAPAPLQSS
jgi:hypothetical protein